MYQEGNTVARQNMTKKGLVQPSLLVHDWQAFYRETFGIDTISERDELPIVTSPSQPLLHLFVPKALTELTHPAYDEVLKVCRKMFPVQFSGDTLDRTIAFESEVRNPARSTYSIFIDGGIAPGVQIFESVESLLGSVGYPTLLERLLLELWYFTQYGKHLDELEGTHTLCLGTRSRGGHIPYVSWKNNHLVIHFLPFAQLSRRQHLYSREATSTFVE